MKVQIPELAKVYYGFCNRRIPGALAANHTDYAKQALSTLFNLHPDAVRVEGRKQLANDEPFQITGYISDSRTCDEARVWAAKPVLPHLRKTIKEAEDCAAILDAWVPGIDASEDYEVLIRMADNYMLPSSKAQRAWLLQRAEAYAVGHSTLGRLKDSQLAAIILAYEGGAK